MTAVDPPPPGGIRHRIWLFEPGPARDGLAALFSIEREIEDSARPGLEHAVGHVRLDWWEEESALLAAGRPRHPATRRLASVLAASGHMPPDLRPLVEAARWRLAQLALESRAELDALLRHWAGTVFATTLSLGGADLRPDATTPWHELALRGGTAIREIELLCRLHRLAVQGLVYLPLEELSAAALSHAECQRQPFPSLLAVLLRRRLEASATALRETARSVAPTDRIAARSALLWMAQSLRLARRAISALPMEYAAPRLAPLADTIAAWRAARRCLRGELPGLS